MQVSAGTVAVVNNSTAVISTEDSFASDWSTLSIGDWFMTSSHSVAYQIGQILDPSTSVSGFWELVLTVPYMGLSNTAEFYAITSDFTLYASIPLLQRGDAESATIFSRAMTIVDSFLSTFNGRLAAVEAWVAPASVVTHRVTLPASSAIALLPGKTYRLDNSFAAGGSFSVKSYLSEGACSNSTVQMFRNEAYSTVSRASWTVFVPTNFTGTATFSGVLAGTFSSGTLTLNTAQSSWVITQLD